MAELSDRSNLPLVSVIVVNYRGADDTMTCLRALREELDYPSDRLEVICVDNASGDGSAEQIRAAAPEVRLIESDTNLGFAGGCNLAARNAGGQVLAFLNNDAKPDRAWVRAAVAVLRSEPTVGAVASKVLDWEGRHIDFVDGGLTWFGMGYKRHAGEVDDGSHDAARDVLFGTGSALFVRAELFAALDGFDERFFMFYEDVDLGWRLNLRGWRVRYEPRSLTFHRHHASMAEVSSAREHYLLERNALAALYKNVSDETLAKALPAAMALSVRRATARGEIDPTQLEITKRGDREDDNPVPIDRSALAGMLAIDQFVELLPSLKQSREEEQQARVRTDADLVPLMRKAMEPAYPLPRYLAAHDALVEAFELDAVFGRPRKVVVITGDAVTERMAGPAIRAWHMSEVLAAEHEVRLVSVNALVSPPESDFEVVAAKPRELGAHVDWADVVVLQGHVLEMVPALKHVDSTKIVVCDVYDPMHLELLEQGRDTDDERRAKDLVGVTKVLNTQLRRGDFFLCASERQRHFWLGHLASLGRLTPGLYDNDPTVRSLLSVVPFGLPSVPPRRTGPAIKGNRSGIAAEDKVVLWAGGVYSWFDPLTLLHAMHRLSQQHNDVRLFFLGMKHPNPDVPEMDMAERTRGLARRLGLTDKFVFFNETWVPYGERQNYLLDADCGVTTHFEHVETTFAFRTRVLDYLWSGLPVVTTDGDSFADLVRAQGIGVVVPAEDPDALAAALEKALYDEEFAAECRRRIAPVRERFAWESVLAPLTEFCRDPRPAADRLDASAPLVRSPRLNRADTVRRDISLLREYLDAGGPLEVAKRATGRLRRLAGERFRGR
ncbi:GT2 family glycosyltransferase/glycosyltransferase involved in cell wall biosynthesis [Saccharopolyspora phatthalungensis]|uniref:GT2 family glycosyltransferase/glycosyltransferase involved in cell wall biosynthesis n=1 Tax=Saccharopolyspora phatthalungensis TaxID=664693 RepID=A0A840Q5I6_9PSEU|nr:glycosyltransferase [Saccharopolyspora phatthalungensis]MBB5155140.1 GT2 family glycosyltransferase/glycosyltransferase involved in cell wall biosynthesis [Saccharopolyspora phatthalungensis]